MTINTYVEVIMAFMLTIGAIGMTSVIIFVMLVMWASLSEGWHE